MSKIIISVIALSMSGCGFGYSVYDRSTYDKENNAAKLSRFACVETKPAFFIDNTMAICDTNEQCNKICADMRDKK